MALGMALYDVMGKHLEVPAYNLMGQKVAELVNDVRNAGYHTVTWQGTDRAGRPVSSGVYFSELRARGFRQTKKMLLLK